MNKYAIRPNSRQTGTRPRDPVRKFSELVDHFDVLPGQLRNAMRDSEIRPPEPSLVSGKDKYYKLCEMERWFNAIGGRDAVISNRFNYFRDWRGHLHQSAMTH